MAAGSIVIDLLMRTGSFETDTKRAEQRLRQLQAEAKKVGAAIGVAFVAAATATAYFVKSSIDAADAAIKNAQAIGLTVEAYSSLAFAADLSGVSQEEMGTALTRLAKKAAEAAAGGKSAAAGFDALGISVRNADGSIKDTDQLLTEMAGKFAGYADGAEKTALATEFFGRSGAKLIPLLNSGADGIEAMRREAADLGIVLDTQTARAAEQFNDDLSRLAARVRGFGNVLAREALPALNDINAMLLDVARNEEAMGTATEFLRAILGGVLNVFQTLAVIGSDLIFVLRGTGREIGALAAQAVALAKLDFRGFRAISSAVTEDAQRARAELDKFQARIMGLGSSGANLGAQLGAESPMLNPSARAPRVGDGGAGAAGAAKADEATRYLETLRKQLQATSDLGVEEALLADIQAGRLGKVSAAQEADLRSVAQQIDMARRRQDQFKAEAEQERDLAAQQASVQRELAQIYDATRSPVERLNIELARLAQLRTVAGADLDALARAELDLWERYDQAVKKTADTADSFAKTMAENVQTFLGGALADVMEGNFKSIGNAFVSMVNRMVAEAVAADLARRLFGDNISGGAGGGWVGTAISAAGAYFGGAKAGGGDVMPGRDYWVGENGPERFRPRSMGTILPAGASGGAQRSLSQVLNINVQGQVDSRTAAQIGVEAGRALRRADRMNG